MSENTPIRGSDVYLVNDLRRILRALVLTQATHPSGPSTDYSRGFIAALGALALAVGVDVDELRQVTL